MNENELNLKRSLGWRLSTIAIVFLTATCFIMGWVKVTSIVANKDVRVEEIKAETTIKTLESQNSAQSTNKED